MGNRTRAGFALMVVIAVILGIFIGVRNVGMQQNEGLYSVGEILDTGMESDKLSTGQSPEVSFEDPMGETSEEWTDSLDALRMERSRTRSRNIEALEAMAGNLDLSEEARAAAGIQLLDISKRTEAELEAEALIRARGYKDALVFTKGDSCDVVISGEVLGKADAEQIGDIIARYLGVELANITIIERNGI
ncbi:MAG: SpoIIIAH-like family protein [Firmicutes bacterium]|nr:SpoIIIAH-like family protein [Bacillota bacterium]